MLKIKKEKRKIYDFKYNILWKDGNTTEGYITGSELTPSEIFLNDAITYYASGKAYYYNTSEIKVLEILDMVEKVEE